MLDNVIFRDCAIYSSLAQVEDEAVLLVHRRRGEVDLPHFNVPLPLDLHARGLILESIPRYRFGQLRFAFGLVEGSQNYSCHSNQ